MQVLDVRGNIIKIGDYARYTGTGTVGKVINIKEEENNQWAELDKVNLWYSHELLEVLDSKDVKIKDEKEVKEVDIDSIKDLQSDLENVELESNVAEGGG